MVLPHTLFSALPVLPTVLLIPLFLGLLPPWKAGPVPLVLDTGIQVSYLLLCNNSPQINGLKQ